jgi:hypothetical protein
MSEEQFENWSKAHIEMLSAYPESLSFSIAFLIFICYTERDIGGIILNC